MKVFAVLFCFYITYLLTLPCVDGSRHSMHNQVNDTPLSQESQDNTRHDDCSPFCFCSCCSIPILLAGFHFECKPVIVTQSLVFFEYQFLITSFISPIWQPPKLS